MYPLVDLSGVVRSFRLALLLALLAFAALAPAQTLNDYLKLRKKYGISAAASVAALDTLIGSRIVEIKGVVRGDFTVGGVHSLLLERADGGFDKITAPHSPDWLEGNAVPARLIVKAERKDENDELQATLIVAAPESSIAEVEAEVAAAEAAAERRHHKAAMRAPTTDLARRLYTPYRDVNQVVRIYAGFVKKQNRRLSNTQALRIAQAILGFSQEYGVDARLIIAMVMAESGFDPNSTSRTGAMGLGQLMPGTAKWMGVTNAYDTTDNLYGTVKLVRTHLNSYRQKTGGDEFRSIALMLAAYNAGEGAVSRSGNRIPPYRETQAYVRKVISIYLALCGIRR